MARLSLLFGLLGTIVLGVQGYPNGAPPGACVHMTPVGHIRPNNPNKFEGDELKKYWSIRSGCYVIFPGDKMNMWVYDLGDGGDYKGLLLTVKDSRGMPAGRFVVRKGDPFKTFKCRGAASSAVTHSNRSWKKPSTHMFLWEAPATCVRNSVYTIHATIVKEFTPTSNAWVQDIQVKMVCDPDFGNKQVMLTARPPAPSLYCAVGTPGQWAVIPPAVTTSFEKPQPPNGWKHFYFAKEISLRRTNTSTPSRGTGPDKAQDGDWFLYYEATGQKERDMAGIYSPYGIQGCFCFSFWCHMETDGTALFTVSAIGPKSSTILYTVERTDFWRQVQLTIVAEYPTIIAIQVFRGDSHAGDIGIDNIELKKGECADKTIPRKDIY